MAPLLCFCGHPADQHGFRISPRLCRSGAQFLAPSGATTASVCQFTQSSLVIVTLIHNFRMRKSQPTLSVIVVTEHTSLMIWRQLCSHHSPNHRRHLVHNKHLNNVRLNAGQYQNNSPERLNLAQVKPKAATGPNCQIY